MRIVCHICEKAVVGFWADALADGIQNMARDAGPSIRKESEDRLQEVPHSEVMKSDVVGVGFPIMSPGESQ